MAFWRLLVADGQHQRLHYRSDESGLAVQLARTTSSSCSTSRWTTCCGTPKGHHLSRCPQGTGEMVDLVAATTVRLPDEDHRGPPHDSGVDKATSVPASGLAIAGEITAGHGGAIAVERASRRWPSGPASSPAASVRRAESSRVHPRDCGVGRRLHAKRTRRAGAAGRGRTGRVVSHIRGDPRQPDSGPHIRISASTRSRRRAVSTTWPACARGTSVWDSSR